MLSAVVYHSTAGDALAKNDDTNVCVGTPLWVYSLSPPMVAHSFLVQP